MDPGEACDDGNTRNNDGCTNCVLDPIQLEFNSSVPAGTDYRIEFFDLDEPVFFVDPSFLRFSLAPYITVRPVAPCSYYDNTDQLLTSWCVLWPHMSMRSRGKKNWVCLGWWMASYLSTNVSSFHNCFAEVHKKCMHGAHKIAMMAVSLLLTPSNYAPCLHQFPVPWSSLWASLMYIYRQEIAETQQVSLQF